MASAAAASEYLKALHLGLKEMKDRQDAGLDPYPAVLENILPRITLHTIQELPAQEIPIERIAGTKTAGRTNAFSAGFYPLLSQESEFAGKWISLCEAHLSDTGIRDAILCYEYLGDFYVEEGNKRVSVLKYFGAVRSHARVRRVLPLPSEEPRIRAYGEFLHFFSLTGLYDIQYKKPGDYARLLSLLGRDPDDRWSEEERRSFSARYHYFQETFGSLEGKHQGLCPEEALLLWLKVYSYEQLGSMSAKELKASLNGLWADVVAESGSTAPQLRTVPENESRSLLGKLISPSPSHLQVALICQMDAGTSPWTKAHLRGAREMEEALAPAVTLRSYFHADSPAETDALLEQAVADGADLVFTTTPLLLRTTLRAAVRHPRVRFFNCSVDTPLSSVRSYYCRTYEGKFITGLIAGALAENDQIGYVGSYPILGVPASINAFALGARMTNPRARILLECSGEPGNAARRLREKGIRVVSNRDIPLQNPALLTHGSYGTYLMDEAGELTPLASPVWLWGKLYGQLVRSVLTGSLSVKKEGEAVNYWWGMDSGVVDVEFSDRIPEGVLALAGLMIRNIREGRLDPFRRRITAQDGSLKNDGSRSFSPIELIRMDWLLDNVEGRIPAFEELSGFARPLVRELGIYRDQIPPEKGGGA